RAQHPAGRRVRRVALSNIHAAGRRQRAARRGAVWIDRLRRLPRRRGAGRHPRAGTDSNRRTARAGVPPRGDREARGITSAWLSRRACDAGERTGGPRHSRHRRRVLGAHPRREWRGPRVPEVGPEEPRPRNRRVADALVHGAAEGRGGRRSRCLSDDAARCEMSPTKPAQPLVVSAAIHVCRAAAGRPECLRCVWPLAVLIAAVTATSLVAQDGQWLMYSGSYSSHRYSPLTQLTPANVAKLRPVWVYQPPGTGSVESTPLVVNDVMYVTSGPTMVAALDLRSGKALWEWTQPIAASVLNLGFPRVNRGVAVRENMVYVGTLDGYLVALDARSGVVRWSVHVGENP